MTLPDIHKNNGAEASEIRWQHIQGCLALEPNFFLGSRGKKVFFGGAAAFLEFTAGTRTLFGNGKLSALGMG